VSLIYQPHFHCPEDKHVCFGMKMDEILLKIKEKLYANDGNWAVILKEAYGRVVLYENIGNRTPDLEQCFNQLRYQNRHSDENILNSHTNKKEMENINEIFVQVM
jgi:hypothetical protein